MTNTNENTDYNNDKIYKIVSPNCEKVYYASTTDILNYRFNKHKTNRACTSREIIDAGDADIIEIEKYPCSCVEELEDREAYFIVNDWDGCVNERRAGGMKVCNKIRNATPERKAKRKEYAEKLEVKVRKKAYDATPEKKAKRNEKSLVMFADV